MLNIWMRSFLDVYVTLQIYMRRNECLRTEELIIFQMGGGMICVYSNGQLMSRSPYFASIIVRDLNVSYKFVCMDLYVCHPSEFCYHTVTVE